MISDAMNGESRAMSIMEPHVRLADRNNLRSTRFQRNELMIQHAIVLGMAA